MRYAHAALHLSYHSQRHADYYDFSFNETLACRERSARLRVYWLGVLFKYIFRSNFRPKYVAPLLHTRRLPARIKMFPGSFSINNFALCVEPFVHSATSGV